MNRFKVLLLVAMATAFALGYSPPIPTDITQAVNMSTYGDRLFVSDEAVGVHVYNVSDPASPAHMYTIPLHANHGNAVVGDVLYASDGYSIKAFHLGEESYVQVAEIAAASWEPPNPPYYEPHDGFGCSCSDNTMSPRSAPAPSASSSYATFAVVGDYLYAVRDGQLAVINVSDPLKPFRAGVSHTDWEVETLQAAGGYLFMGGVRGMYIYSLDAPASPQLYGKLIHARACDPVVVEGTTAYVTLRSGAACGVTKDELLSVDISDPAAPALLCETDVPTPFGLATGPDRLFVSKGNNGFALYDVTAPDKPALVASWTDATRDFIWDGTVLYSMTEGGVAIYDVTDPAAPSIKAIIQ